MNVSLSECFHVIIPRPLETTLIYQKNLCRCSEDRDVGMRLLWITGVGCKSNVHDRQKRERTEEIYRRGGSVDTETETRVMSSQIKGQFGATRS